MIRTLLATTALAFVSVSSFAYAAQTANTQQTQTMAPKNSASATDNNDIAAAPAASSAAPDTTAAIGSNDKASMTPVDPGKIRTQELVGTTVYGANDANVGEIGDVVLTKDGKVDAVIVDVGGFLGMGEKEVAVGMNKLSFMCSSPDDSGFLQSAGSVCVRGNCVHRQRHRRNGETTWFEGLLLIAIYSLFELACSFTG